MGRGRAKAKQTKVARELKYSSGNTDLTALQRELAGPSGGTRFSTTTPSPAAPVEDDYEDPYAALVEDEDEEPGPAHVAR